LIQSVIRHEVKYILPSGEKLSRREQENLPASAIFNKCGFGVVNRGKREGRYCPGGKIFFGQAGGLRAEKRIRLQAWTT
jgi:hypothetical protein